MLCVVMAELPVLLPVTDVAEALLRTLHGPSFICRMVANMPDTFYEGEKQYSISFRCSSLPRSWYASVTV